MSQIENSGYKGEALRMLKVADCDIGDIVRVTSKGKVYEKDSLCTRLKSYGKPS